MSGTKGAGCSTSVIWDDRFLDYDFGLGHPFSERSRALAVRLLEHEGFFDRVEPPGGRLVQDVPVASSGQLRAFHSPEYLSWVRTMSQVPVAGFLDGGDTPAFAGCFDASARLVGGTLHAWTAVRDQVVSHAFNPGGGFHHARPGRASGFCIFNDLAVMLRSALDGGGLRKVAYVDVDVHHGDGVMYGFYEDGRLLTIDVHQDGRTIFPGTGFIHETGKGDGAGLKVNVPLPPGSGDEAFVPLFQKLVPPLLRNFRPELIVLQTGVDGHVGDRLGGLQYTPRAYDEAVSTLHALAHELCQGRLVATGGGGYVAAHVARVFARTAGILGARPMPASEDAELPAKWRAEFESMIGEPAPHRWGEVERPSQSPWRREKEEKLLGDLSQALGMRFG